jgi:hypothetical protein
MKSYLSAFSRLISKKIIWAVFITILALCVTFISLPPAEAAAEAEPGAKYYLPTYFPASETEISPAGPATRTVPAAGLLNLEAPAQVAAGETFVLSLSTGEGFPLLVNEDAAFFESCDGGEPQLAGICTLDAQGTACLQLQRTKVGAYRYNVLAGPFQSEITVTVLPGRPAVIQEMQERLFLEAGSRATVEFAVEDSYGNKIAAGSTAEKPAKEQLAVLITGPANGSQKIPLPEAEFSVTANPAGNFVVSFAAEKIGDYLVEASIPGIGASARSLVCARELGAVTGVELAVRSGKEPCLRLSGDAAQPGRLELEVILCGENNFTKTPSPAEERNIIFSTDRPDLLLIEKTSESRALLTEKGKGGLATVTVTYVGEGKGLQKSIPIWIAGDPAQIKPEIKVSDLTALVQIALVDKEGRLAWEKTKGYRIDIPAGLRIAAQNEFARGKAEFVLKAKEYGNYTVGITTGEGLSRNLKINFLEKIKPARHAVIFIGQKGYIKDGQPAKMSPAPEICYGRVFVPVEFLSDAFGVEVSAFPGMEKITLQSQSGIKMIIDRTAQQLTITNAKDGSTITTPIGRLFLQKKAGTYFVPAGIIARIFGAEVDYLPKRDQIEHVTFIRK